MRSTLVIMAAVLAAYGSALALERAAGLDLGVVIMAVALALTLARNRVSRAADRTDKVAAFAVLPAVAVASWGIGRLLGSHPDLGGALFVLAMSASVWIRRFGDRATRMGTLIALPLVVSLVMGGGQGGAGWTAVVALIACAWVTVVLLVATRTGSVRPPAPAAPASAAVSAAASAAPSDNSKKRLPASTRMAMQMGTALAGSFLLGRFLWPQHWTWVVISAFVVCSGTRGRGDVLYKGILRAGGAAAGTLAGAAAGGVFGPRSDAAVVLIFAALATATWLRAYSYAYWAAIITGVISLLYGWLGISTAGPLHTRLCGLLLGAAIAVVASWLMLPVRTGDLLRRRAADVAAALRALRGTDRSDAAALRRGQAAYARSSARLHEIAPPLRAQRLVFSRWLPGLRYGADAVDALAGCAEPVRVLASIDAEAPELTGAQRAIDDALRVLSVMFAPHQKTPHQKTPHQKTLHGKASDDC
jgi:hypothetical protein